MFEKNTWWRNQQSILREAQKEAVKTKIELAFLKGSTVIEVKYLLEETKEYFKGLGVCFYKNRYDEYEVYDCNK